jgi:FixJ family two-component response regulator
MAKKHAYVYVVDDDASMRKGVLRLLKSLGFQAQAFASADEFLEAGVETKMPSCLVLDIRMPGLSGMELQEALRAREYSMPIVFITGHGDVPMSVKAMKLGAVDFLKKPFDQDDLLEAIHNALAKDKVARADFVDHKQAQELAEKLTSRETEILSYVITGMLNKQIADALDIGEKTVKAHRGQATDKLGIYSVAALVRFAEKAGIPPIA